MNKRSRRINAIIESDKKAEETVIKLLLLGAGESGKSTILKQMKIIHDNGYTQDEAAQKISVVCANTVQSIGAIIDGMKALNIPFASKQSSDYAALIKRTLDKKDEFQPLTEEMYKAIKTLWNDKGVEAAFERRDEFYLHDSAKYFLDALDRIYDKNFVPTEQDILRTRIATMGVIEVCFTMKNKLWRVFDVGGQRSQRKKWIHCFDDAKAVIYVASLSEYDQVLLEDDSTNRMQESLQLFRQVINNKYFVNTSVILFLNKKDLFEKKIGHGRSLRIAFPNYRGQRLSLFFDHHTSSLL
ncbi:g-protein alpha subunit [Oesophagostomum dentatum]|uniref:G-protein alpha subunit n=1 Tax=Oesophagostomum dentatum TaxID=61180 RepID=A0A0B1TBF3_OESDE|nr:g-protein alpha subunit [Oesophagostomum dentatum]